MTISPGRGACVAASVALSIALTACDAADDAETRATTSESTTSAGARAPDDAAPFATSADFVLPFETSVPAPLTASVEETHDTGDMAGAVRFAPPISGDTVFLRLVVFEEGVQRGQAVGLARSISTDFGVIGSKGMEYEDEIPRPGHPWSIIGFRLRGVINERPTDGWLSLGEHDGHYFYLMALYPPGQADRYEPAFDRIMRAWTWTGPDGDAKLHSERSAPAGAAPAASR